MEMVRDWRRQAVRAVGASLLGPLVLLSAAGVLAVGGGFGGLGSLGQIASGPALPDTGQTAAPTNSIANDEIVGADTSEPAAPAAGAATAPGTLAPAPRGGAGAGSGTVNVTPLPAAGAPPATTPPSTGTPGPTAPGNTGGGGGASPPPGQDIIGTTRGVGKAVPEPLRGTTDDILDLLLTPKGR